MMKYRILKRIIKWLWSVTPLPKRKKIIIEYEMHWRRKLYYLRRDVSVEIADSLVAQYKRGQSRERDVAFRQRFEHLKTKYRKIHIVKNNILNIGPLCDLYISLLLLLDKYNTDEKILLLLCDNSIPIYDENNQHISNRWFLHKIKDLVEVIDIDMAPFWGYVVKEHPDFCWFDSVDSFGRVVYPDRKKMMHQEINRYPSKAYFSFSRQEWEKGEKALQDMGIKGKEYFCFFSRNNEYHEQYFENQGTDQAARTELRNSSIKDFVYAIQALDLNEIKGVRVGAVDSRKVEGKNILDYTNNYRDEFLDFFVMGQAKFFFGDPSGIACIPWLMNVPQAITNNLSIFWCSDVFYNYNSTMNFTIYKKWWDRDKERYLTLREILNISWKYGVTDEDEITLYHCLGIDFHANTREEITDFLYEMNLRVDGKWNEDDEAIMLRKKFWQVVNEAILKAPPEIALWDYEPGSLFLKRNQWLLE